MTLFGYATFGRETWHARGEGFAVAFGYLARMAPLTAIDGRLRFRWPFTGLAGDEPVPGSLAVIAVMLGSVAFDGVSRTSHWQNVIADVKDPFIPDSVSTGELLAMLVNLAALLAFCLFVALAYRVCCAVMRASVAAERSLVPEFLLSLVPIAFVYALAHYFSLSVTQGQYVWPLLSDPFGRGWDLFGSAGYRPDFAILTPHTIWYVQAGVARRRPRRRPRSRPRPRGHPVPGSPPGAALAVRDARADGALHRRRALDPVAQLAPVGEQRLDEGVLAGRVRRAVVREAPREALLQLGVVGAGRGVAAEAVAEREVALPLRAAVRDDVDVGDAMRGPVLEHEEDAAVAALIAAALESERREPFGQPILLDRRRDADGDVEDRLRAEPRDGGRADVLDRRADERPLQLGREPPERLGPERVALDEVDLVAEQPERTKAEFFHDRHGSEHARGSPRRGRRQPRAVLAAASRARRIATASSSASNGFWMKPTRDSATPWRTTVSAG